jgi:hypothetical protein
MAHPSGGGEDYDKGDAQQEEQETEDLARTVVLPGVAVAGCLEYDDVDNPNDKNDPDPGPERASCGHDSPPLRALVQQDAAPATKEGLNVRKGHRAAATCEAIARLDPPRAPPSHKTQRRVNSSRDIPGRALPWSHLGEGSSRWLRACCATARMESVGGEPK